MCIFFDNSTKLDFVLTLFSFLSLHFKWIQLTWYNSHNTISFMEEKMLTLKQESEIKEKAQKIKEEKKLRKIYPMVVFGEDGDEKEVYVAYMSEPTFPQFSKFMAASKKDEVMAMRTLARDCFIDGDRELVDNDSMFLFGLMGQLSELITTRQSTLVNL